MTNMIHHLPCQVEYKIEIHILYSPKNIANLNLTSVLDNLKICASNHLPVSSCFFSHTLSPSRIPFGLDKLKE